jgi:predicted small integral membrane protein
MEVLARAERLVQSMYWTVPTAIFFTSIVAMLVVMTLLELRRPTVTRKGFLPMATTRGDRLFIGLLGSAWIHLGWLALLSLPLWYGSAVAALWFVVVLALG